MDTTYIKVFCDAPLIRSIGPPQTNKPTTKPMNLSPKKMLDAPSLRKPPCVSRSFSLPTSCSFLGCSGLAMAGVAFSSMLETEFFLPFSSRRLLGSRISSSRSSARVRRPAKKPSSHQVTTANRPKMAIGSSFSKLIRSANNTASHLDIDDFSDNQRPEDLHDHAAGEHLLAHRVGEQHHHVFWIEPIHRQEQRRRQRQQDDARQAAFAGERLHLSPNLEPLAYQLANLVENFGQ